MQERIAVMGLGYVGLPVAMAFAEKFPGAVGFDVNKEKVDELRRGYDRNQEVSEAELKASSLKITCDLADLKGITFFVVAVPTPVDHNNVPDLTPVVKASETVGKALSKGAVVVYESTVYPGVTEEVCGPLLAKVRVSPPGRISPSATPPSESTRATKSTRSPASPRWCRARTDPRSNAWRTRTVPSSTPVFFEPRRSRSPRRPRSSRTRSAISTSRS